MAIKITGLKADTYWLFILGRQAQQLSQTVYLTRAWKADDVTFSLFS